MTSAIQGFKEVGVFHSGNMKYGNEYFRIIVRVSRKEDNHTVFHLRSELHSTFTQGKEKSSFFFKDYTPEPLLLQSTKVLQVIAHPENMGDDFNSDLLDAFVVISIMATRALTRNEPRLHLDEDGIVVSDVNTPAESKLQADITKFALGRFRSNIKLIITGSWLASGLKV